MKKTILVLVALFYLAAVPVTIAYVARHPKVEMISPPKSPLTSEQQAWLGGLEWCESRGNPNAINPKDRDGTPSYGLLQFKPGTFTAYEKEYGVTGALMDPTAQAAIVTQLILNPKITAHEWRYQLFPGCTKILGTPPLSPKT